MTACPVFELEEAKAAEAGAFSDFSQSCHLLEDLVFDNSE
jgi:hypothetical protein